ncbi:MAG: single-stranded DNA-binding protein [Pseudanabaenaceae cyanobacterium]
MINKIHLVGRAGRDPEITYFDAGRCVCKFPLAVNRRTSNREEPPDWFDIELWDKRAEIAANYVKKGHLVGIVGSLRFDRWRDKNTGEDRSRPVILVEELELLTSKKEAEAMAMGGTDF